MRCEMGKNKDETSGLVQVSSSFSSVFMMKGTLDLRYYYVEKLLLQGLPVNELTEKERRHELGQSRSIKVIV